MTIHEASTNQHVRVISELFLALARVIRKTNIIDETGMVWKSYKHKDGSLIGDGKSFYIGIGTDIKTAVIAKFDIGAAWDSCYFAKELETMPFGEVAGDFDIDEITNRISNILP